MARLDRLAEGKPVAQLASILGREFSFALIHALSDVGDDTLRWGLEQLVEAEVLFQRGSAPVSTYQFKHALLQDTAYESQLKTRRRSLHARTAEILIERFPARVEAEPAAVARHFAEGRLNARAVDQGATSTL